MREGGVIRKKAYFYFLKGFLTIAPNEEVHLTGTFVILFSV